MKCFLLGFLPSGSEWIIIGLFVALPFYFLIFKLIIAIIRYLNRK